MVFYEYLIVQMNLPAWLWLIEVFIFTGLGYLLGKLESKSIEGDK